PAVRGATRAAGAAIRGGLPSRLPGLVLRVGGAAIRHRRAGLRTAARVARPRRPCGDAVHPALEPRVLARLCLPSALPRRLPPVAFSQAHAPGGAALSGGPRARGWRGERAGAAGGPRRKPARPARPPPPLAALGIAALTRSLRSGSARDRLALLFGLGSL